MAPKKQTSSSNKQVRKTDLKGLKAAKAATTMTTEMWRKSQVGMKEKWPQPE